VAGAVAFTAYIVARSALTAGTDPIAAYRDRFWVPINALGLLGAVLVLLGLPALAARMAPTTGALGRAGLMLIAIAWVFLGVFLSLFGLLIAPWLAEKAPALVATDAPLPAGFLVAFVVAIVAQCVGTVLLAIPFLRGRVQPRWIGYLLPAAALLTVVGDAIAPSGPASNLALNLVSNVGPVLLLIALGYLALGAGTAHTL
jgi:hypothetical protein